MTPAQANAHTIAGELQWFAQVLDTRLKRYFGQQTSHNSIYDIPMPEVMETPSFYQSLLEHYEMSFAERLILVLALIPHIQPELLTPLTQEPNANQINPVFGCITNQNSNQVLPTRQTAYFLLSENNLLYRISIGSIFDKEHFFFKHNILQFTNLRGGMEHPMFSEEILTISDEYMVYLTSGDEYFPDYSLNFPAKRLTTPLEWEDLVLENYVMDAIQDIKSWLQFGHILINDWGLGKKTKKGFRCLFYGPSGTGKTLTASLLGKATNRAVFRVDLSMTISKYIGETEKNLARLFDQAENKNWILFFDEADALFTKRVESKDSHDRSANQQIAYLLQRVEDYDGLVILCSNLKQQLDPAFTRRFESMVYFPVPNPELREKIWRNNFENAYYNLEPKIDFSQLSEKFELTGGNIINILKYACIKAISRNTKKLLLKDIHAGIRKELAKEGKTI